MKSDHPTFNGKFLNIYLTGSALLIDGMVLVLIIIMRSLRSPVTIHFTRFALPIPVLDLTQFVHILHRPGKDCLYQTHHAIERVFLLRKT